MKIKGRSHNFDNTSNEKFPGAFGVGCLLSSVLTSTNDKRSFPRPDPEIVPRARNRESPTVLGLQVALRCRRGCERPDNPIGDRRKALANRQPAPIPDGHVVVYRGVKFPPSASSIGTFDPPFLEPLPPSRTHRSGTETKIHLGQNNSSRAACRSPARP